MKKGTNFFSCAIEHAADIADEMELKSMTHGRQYIASPFTCDYSDVPPRCEA
jgi:hypothetical protein